MFCFDRLQEEEQGGGRIRRAMSYLEDEERSKDPDAAAATPPVWIQVYNRLVDIQHDAVRASSDLAEQLQSHFERLPHRYAMDVDLERVEDVLIHKELLELALIPENRPVFFVSFSERMSASMNDSLEQYTDDASSVIEGHAAAHEPHLNIENLALDSRTNVLETEDRRATSHGSSNSQLQPNIHIHEITFSTIDKPKVLSQLSALLADIGLNIREAHVFSTNDGYSLDVFLVDGWQSEDTCSLHKALEDAVANTEKEKWARHPTKSSPVKELTDARKQMNDCEVDIKLLKLDRKVASGSCGDLYRGTYLGQDVAIKVLKPECLNKDIEYEFSQEVMILRKVKHKNVVRFIGACTKPPHLRIVTEYMSGGSLYDYLHRQESALRLPTLVRYAIDVSKGMEYLHENNIIHRDLKAANLLLDKNYVVKIADFGVARFLTQNGLMTAETGTYRWMAPEVINHQPYDQKADVFSFAIVLWELLTAKLPYETMTPLQAALGVRQGLRPPIPETTHPEVARILERCWEGDPAKRPSFSETTVMLENILEEVLEADENCSSKAKQVYSDSMS